MLTHTFPSNEAPKFMVRLPDGMREELKAAAKAAGRSMNAEIVTRLASWKAEMAPAELPITAAAPKTDAALRDHFASLAMPVFLEAVIKSGNAEGVSKVAEVAYGLADLMVEVRAA